MARSIVLLLASLAGMCRGQSWDAALGTWDLYRRMADLVTPYGYPLEEHVVTTEDGYILRSYRIPHGKHGSYHKSRPPVLLLPGAQCSSTEWALLGPDQALAFLLADAGYDVWMGNLRGCVFSREHKWLSTLSKAYWAFSYDEMAKYDFPAILDDVLGTTGHSSLLFIGYSQGNTIALAALIEQPHLVPKIKLAVMMAPIVFLKHIANPPLIIGTYTGIIDIANRLGPLELPPLDGVLRHTQSGVCTAAPLLCWSAARWLVVFSKRNIDPHMLGLFYKYEPEGSSTQNFLHLAQHVREPTGRKFMHFDYGLQCDRHSLSALQGQCNQVKYGTLEPPLYNLSKISTPLYFVTGELDSLADPTDVQHLVEALPKGVIRKHLKLSGYEHLDQVWGKNIGEDINRHVVQFLADG